ncbi:hypothetical protein PHISP_01464 [Aspergillus sp. HF37]|nr:hypothetical protein PHISP_01464 [Aspergillus sp. HF37]
MDREHRMANFSILTPAASPILSPRLGQLAIAGAKPVRTPHYLPLTSRGALPHLSHDIVRDHTAIGSTSQQNTDIRRPLGLRSVIERQARHGEPPIYKTPAAPHESALRRFTCMPDDFLLVLGPRRVPSIVSPTPNTPTSVSILTSTGFSQLRADEYAEAVRKLQPDIAVGMADLVMGREPGRKRRGKMVDRTHAHTMHAAEKLYGGSGPDAGQQQQRVKSAFFAPVLPLENTQQSLYLEELENELWPEPPTPHDALKEVSLGADLLTLPFLVASSDAGMALDFVFPPPPSGSDASRRPLAFNLWSSEYAADLSPLSDNCSCYTCQNHHRAYLNHLLIAKEMLAWTLLQVHNHHVVDNFFSGIRASIEKGTFDEDAQAFHRVYTASMPERTGEGPRLRGYQLPVIKGPGPPPRYPKVFNRLDDAADKFAESKSALGTPDAGADELESCGFAEKKGP